MLLGVNMDGGEYYFSKKPELMENFRSFSERIGIALSKICEAEFVREVLDEMKNNFENFIPLIPYIGGDSNPMTPNLISSVHYLMVYKVLKGKGMDLKDVGMLCYNNEDEFFRSHPEFIPPLLNPQVSEYMKQSAKDSGKYPEDFVYSYLDGEDFDLGLDFTECALLKLFKKYNAEEFMPYICAMDIVMSEYGNLGLHRTKTLADGFEICNFRYKAGRDSKVKSKVIHEYVKDDLK